MALLHYNSSDSWIRFIFYLKQYNLATNQYKKDDIKSCLFSVAGNIDLDFKVFKINEWRFLWPYRAVSSTF